jgi:hypothetical protein
MSQISLTLFCNPQSFWRVYYSAQNFTLRLCARVNCEDRNNTASNFSSFSYKHFQMTSSRKLSNNCRASCEPSRQKTSSRELFRTTFGKNREIADERSVKSPHYRSGCERAALHRSLKIKKFETSEVAKFASSIEKNEKTYSKKIRSEENNKLFTGCSCKVLRAKKK